MNNKLINYKMIVSFTGQNKEKNKNLFDFRSDPSGSDIPGTGSEDTEPHQNEADSKHGY